MDHPEKGALVNAVFPFAVDTETALASDPLVRAAPAEDSNESVGVS